MTDPESLRLVEALLFASAEPLSAQAVQDRLPPGVDASAVLAELERHYAGRGVNLVRRDNRWAFRTAPDLAGALRLETVQQRRLSRAAVEVLAIIAYHQPVTRGEIEEIRGVALSKGTLDALFEAGWIRPKGRRRTPGRPLTWVTTDAFLDHFGLTELGDLPGLEELKASGLLDARPAADAYGNRAGAMGPLVDTAEEEGEAGEPLEMDDEAVAELGE